VPVTVKTRLAIKNSDLALDAINAVVAGTGVRGQLGIVLGRPVHLEGRLETDTLDLAAVAGLAAGVPAPVPGRSDPAGWPTEPFSPRLFANATGQIAFDTRRAIVTPTLVAQELHGVLRLGDAEASLEDVEARLGGGSLRGQLTLRFSPEGIGARGRLALTDADASAVLPAEVRPALTGHLGLQVEAEGSGLSPASLIGSLHGAGAVTLEGAKIASLDPRAFDAVIRAVDRGSTIDAAKIRDMMDAGLRAGPLSVGRADGAFTITTGQMRWGNVIAGGEEGDLNVSAVIDLSEWTLDARLTLSRAAGEGTAATGRPDIFIALKGPFAAPKRTLDVAAFAGWLTLRAVERQSKQLEVLQSQRQEATGAVTPSAPAAPVAPATPVAPAAQESPAPIRATPEQATETQATAPAEPAPATPPNRGVEPNSPAVEQSPPPAAPSENRPTPAQRANHHVIQRVPMAATGAPKTRANAATRTGANRPPADIPPARRSVLEQLFGPQH
jgi:large subunit ribosomal protein L24